MENSWLTIILVFVIIGGMAFFIMLSTANDVDKETETAVRTDIATFVKECANEGRITAEKVNKLQTSVNSHNIRFDLKIWVERQSDTPTKKTTQLNNQTTEATPYVTEEYSPEDIMEKGVLILRENDIIGASAENISPTNEDTHSGNTGKDYSTMKPQAVETVHTTGSY